MEEFIEINIMVYGVCMQLNTMSNEETKMCGREEH